jgi:hypothetical protein
VLNEKEDTSREGGPFQILGSLLRRPEPKINISRRWIRIRIARKKFANIFAKIMKCRLMPKSLQKVKNVQCTKIRKLAKILFEIFVSTILSYIN